MEINLLSSNRCPSGHLLFSISTIIHCGGELNTVALLSTLCGFAAVVFGPGKKDVVVLFQQ